MIKKTGIGKGPRTEVHPGAVNEKLQKVLARIGLGSRREMERTIIGGRVTVNGKVAKIGDRVSASDKIEFDGRLVSELIKRDQVTRVLLYNKTEGEICSRSDPEGRPSVYRRLPKLPMGRWISVGRLDFNTTGVLLFTNDGDLANCLMHPSTEIDREYLVRVQGEVDEDMLERLREGVLLEDGVAKFTDIQHAPSEGGNQWYYCVVMEGKNREVRRLWESQGLRVSRLKRVRFGNIFIPSYVRMGQWVELNEREVAELCETAGVAPPPAQKFSEASTNARARQRRRLSDPNSLRGKPLNAKKKSAPRRFESQPASENGPSWKRRKSSRHSSLPPGGRRR